MEDKMPAKKAATKAPKKSAASKQAKENQSLQHRKDQEAHDRNAARKKEHEEAVAKAKEEEKAADNVAKENDLVIVDVDNVPEAVQTAPMQASLKGLRDKGMQGRAGRVVGIEDGTHAGERMYVVDGADFTVRVPAAAVHKADRYDRSVPGDKPVAKKRSRKR
jgi:hypothetical protein